MKQIIWFLWTVFALAAADGNVEKWHKTEDGSLLYIETELKYNWFEALSECTRLKMSPISVDSLNKHLQLYNLLKTKFNTYEPKLWTGGHDNTFSRRFEWVSNSEVFSYTNWNNGEPNNKDEKCVLMFSPSLFWNDGHCTTKLGFVCEANPLLSEKNSELSVLKGTLDSQTKLLMEKTEELGSLKQQLDTPKQTHGIENLTKLYQTRFEELKQSLVEISELQKSVEKPTNSNGCNSEVLEIVKQLQEDLGTIKKFAENQTNELVDQHEIIPTNSNNINHSEVSQKIMGNGEMSSANSQSIPEALLKAKTEELEALKISNEMITNQLFSVLMKSYDANMNRNVSYNNFNFYQHFNKNAN